MSRFTAILSLAASLLLAAPAAQGDSRVPTPAIPPAVQGEQCVEETDYMRRHHGHLLNVHRDDALRRGIRTERHSLDGCLQCHSEPRQQPATASSGKQGVAFCASCHSYAGVRIDCFQCHATVPSDSNRDR